MSNGGKASSLIRLVEGGFLIPPFFVCDDTWTNKEIIEKINLELPTIQYFAVRSSAENEDSKEKSFAGHFYSAVGIKKEDVLAEVSRVRSSFRGDPGVVIIQQFIPSDTAGVMFSEVGKGHIVINATIGLCQSVVNGQACDEYLCDKNGSILEKTIPQEKEVKIFNEGRVISQKTNTESLTENKIKELAQVAHKIQGFFGYPQDIEWCFLDDKLYILQSRPITQSLDLGKKEYFDSANIAESYSGIVLSLTCSFAQMVYEQVYKDLLRMSGVSRKKIERNSHIFENLLGFFYGRMYYNMNNWYQMAAFVPGYKRNKANFELMITSNIRQDITAQIHPSWALRISYPFIVATKTVFFSLSSKYFKFKVKKEILRLRGHDFEHLQYKECIRLFNDLHKNLLQRWYVAIENDFFVMTYLGILKKLIKEEALQKIITFRSKATEQVASLATTSKKAKEIKPLWTAILSNNVNIFKEELSRNPSMSKLLKDYLVNFGGRFANELKLESIGVDEDTTKLFSVLKIYSDYEPKLFIPQQKISLPFLKKILAGFILRKFKKYASRREEFRLLRSNTFAIARRLFKRVGVLLTENGAIENANDVFYLRMEEVLNPTTANKELAKLIASRKRDYSYYQTLIPPIHFSTTNDTPPGMQSVVKPGLSNISARPASPGVIRGRVKVFKEFYMPSMIDFDILVTSHTDPGWTSLIALSKGLIIEHGGVLSHASIVARELHIPAVIGATNAISILKDNQMVEIDGSTGVIKIM